MPRSTKSKRAVPYAGTMVGNFNPNDNESENVTVSAATTVDEADVRDDLPFEVNITPAEEGFKPDRSPAGRKRMPSPFETVLPSLKGQGWQNQPHDGKVEVTEIQNDNGTVTTKVLIPQGVKDSNARIILRELSKAVKFLNSGDGGKYNLGLDVNVTPELVQFNVRDKQNRKARTPQGDESSDGEQNDSGESDDQYDSGDE